MAIQLLQVNTLRDFILITITPHAAISRFAQALASTASLTYEDKDMVQQSDNKNGHDEEDMLRVLNEARVAIAQGSIDTACRLWHCVQEDAAAAAAFRLHHRMRDFRMQ